MRHIIAALVLVPVVAVLVGAPTARADGGAGGAPACDSLGVEACDVLDLGAGTNANLHGNDVAVAGDRAVQIGAPGVAVTSDALTLHGDTSATLSSNGAVTVQATGNVSIASIAGAVALHGVVKLDCGTLSVDGGGVVHCL